MNPFMGNTCMHPYCKEPDCKNCCHFMPTCYGIKVPKWLGHMLFNLEWRILSKNESKAVNDF